MPDGSFTVQIPAFAPNPEPRRQRCVGGRTARRGPRAPSLALQRRIAIVERIMALAMGAAAAASGYHAMNLVIDAFKRMIEGAVASGRMRVEHGASSLAALGLLRAWRNHAHASRMLARDVRRHGEILAWVEAHPTLPLLDELVRLIAEADAQSASLLAGPLTRMSDHLGADLVSMLYELRPLVPAEDREMERALEELDSFGEAHEGAQ